jgi:hypothetical protein
MKVRATALGYYGNKRRRPGEVFILKPFKRTIKKFNKETKKWDITILDVDAKMQFSENWMELAEDAAKVIPSKPVKQFGPAMKRAEEMEARPAKSVHEPLSDEESLARDEAEEQEAKERFADQDLI